MIQAADRIEGIIDAPVVKVRKFFNHKPPELDLSQGIPFFSPSPDLVMKTIDQLEDGKGNIYSSDQGREELRNLLSTHLLKYNISSNSQEIVVTPGSNHAAFMVFSLLFSPGDEIVLFRPFYFNHYMSLQILGLNPLIVDSDDDLNIDLEKLLNRISPRTKAIVLVSPNNPSGAMADKTTVLELVEIARKFGLYIISDEAYLDFCWDKSHYSPLLTDYPRIIGLWSFSKSFGISGWRLGWMKLPLTLVPDIIKIADCTHICAPVISQLLGEKLLKHDPQMATKFTPEILANRTLLQKLFRGEQLNQKIKIYPSPGGFYILLRFKNHNYLGGWEVAERFAKNYGIAVLPGEPFGMTGAPFIRISYGNLRFPQLKENENILKQAFLDFL